MLTVRMALTYVANKVKSANVFVNLR